MSILTSEEIWAALSLTGKVKTTDTGILNLIQVACERLVERAVGMTLSSGTVTEYHPVRPDTDPVDPLIDWYDVSNNKVIPQFRRGRDRSLLYLKRGPVRSVTTIYENDNAWASGVEDFPVSSLVPTTDYYLDIDSAGYSKTSMVYRRAGIWTDRPRCIKVTYVAGYTADELGDTYADIKLALLITTVFNFNAFKMQSNRSGIPPGPLTSFKLDSLAVTYDSATMARLYGLQISIPPAAHVILEPVKNYGAFL